MDSFIYSINATVPIFLVMILGGLIRKWGIIDAHFVNKANKYVFDIALPFLLFKDIAAADMTSQFDIKFVLFCMIVTTICFGTVWLICELLKVDDTIIGSFVQGSCRSSAAILGMAFVQNMYSNTGMAPLMIVAAVPLFNIYSVIVLTFKAYDRDEYGNLISGNVKTGSIDGQVDAEALNRAKKAERAEKIKKSFYNILKNPIIIAIFLGLPFSFFHITFPVIVNKTIASVAQTATPIALIVIGAGFEGKKAIKKIKPTLIGTFIKLVLLGSIFVPVAVWIGFRNQELVAILIMLCSPSTVSCYIMARNMNNDGVLASSIIVVTTLLSSVTLTTWIFLLRTFGLI